MNSEQPFPEIDSSLLAGLNRVAAASASAGADESERLARARLRELASEQVHARYELEEEIGRGGMGIVYRVRDTDLQRATGDEGRPRAGAARAARWHAIQ